MASKKEFKIIGHDYVEKIAKKHSNTASVIYLPASWMGKKVSIIRLEE
jgi:hypothetical protein